MKKCAISLFCYSTRSHLAALVSLLVPPICLYGSHRVTTEAHPFHSAECSLHLFCCILIIKNDNDIFTSPSCVCDATVAAAASRVIPRRNVGIINYKQKEN